MILRKQTQLMRKLQKSSPPKDLNKQTPPRLFQVTFLCNGMGNGNAVHGCPFGYVFLWFFCFFCLAVCIVVDSGSTMCRRHLDTNNLWYLNTKRRMKMALLCKHCGKDLTYKPNSPEILKMIDRILCVHCSHDVKDQYVQEEQK